MKPNFIKLWHVCPLFASFAIAPLPATVTAVGIDSSTGPNWRTAAAFEADGEYGSLGYVVFGLNAADSVYDPNWNIGSEQAGNAYQLPPGVTLASVESPIAMWSGNGNFGMLEDPGDANASTPAPLLASRAHFTISREINAAYRITLLTASGDNQGATYSPTVNDGSGAATTSHAHSENGIVYHVFQVSAGTSDIKIELASTPTWSLTGIAFDEFVSTDEGPPLVWEGASSVWDTSTTGNWKFATSGEPAVFSNTPRQAVRFDDLGTATDVEIGEIGLSPLSMEFANSTKAYTLRGEGTIAGLAKLAKTGNGTLTIQNNNTYQGETEIHAGELILSGTGQLGGGTYNGAISNNGAIISASSTNQTFSGPISGTGGITHNGPGTLTISGINTYEGNVLIAGGTFVASRNTLTSSAGAFGNLQIPGKSITVASGGTLRHGNNDLYFNSNPGLADTQANLILAGGTLDTGTYFSNIKTLELHSGASILGTDGVNNGYRSLGLVGTVTVKGGSGVGSTFDAPGMTGGIHLGNSAMARSSVTFDVDAASGGLVVHGPLINQAGSLATGALVKIGDGTLTLAGTNTYTGATTVSHGTLEILGSLEAGTLGVTVGDGAFLLGDGLIDRPVAIESGATLAPAGDQVGSLAISRLTLAAGSTTIMQVHKAGETIDSDLLETTSVTYGGTLELVANGDTFALGDAIKLFESVDSYGGVFTDFVRPTLPEGLRWDFSRLSIDGTANVVNTAPTPLFSPGSGGYTGPQSIAIGSEPGTTIHYTTDGSDPRTSSTTISVASPATGVVVPTDSASFTLSAYSSQIGFGDSPLTSAIYSTVTTPAWNVDQDGNWSLAANWKHDVVASGAGISADFNAFPQTADANVTLDSARTIGSLVFGNANSFDWVLSATPGSLLTLATPSGTPTIQVINRTATFSGPLAGTQGFVKSGDGDLRLANPSSSFSGDIAIDQGNVFATASTGGLNPTLGSLGTPGVTRTITLAPGTTLGFGANDVFGNHASSANVTIAAGFDASIVNIGNFFNILGPVTLDGATIHSIGGAVPGYPSFSFKGTVTALTGATSTISGEGPNSEYHLGDAEVTETTFDVQGNGKLDITAVLQNGESGGIPTSLVKTGSGTLTLGGANTYTGDTTIEEGTLVLPESGHLHFHLGATSGAGNRLTGPGTAAIAGSFVINTSSADALEAGTWKLENVASLVGPYAATFTVVDPDETPWTNAGNDTWTKDNGTGTQWVFDETTGTLTLGDGGAGTFETWAAENGLAGGPMGDSDADGIPNLLEYALASNPAAADGAPGTFANGVLSFSKREVAVGHGDVTYVIEVSSDLGKTDPWIAVTPTLNNDSTISYAIPSAGPRKFARLSVTLAP